MTTPDTPPPRPAHRQTHWLAYLLLPVVAIVGSILVIVATRDSRRTAQPDPFRPPPTTRPATQPVRTIVFIVPGTWGNESAWPNVVPGKVTFGSELLRALKGDGGEKVGEEVTVYPCLWYAANDHAARESAAKALAEVIDEKAPHFDRVCLVGHSHGGSVALWAAGLAHHPVDAVVCLSTPFVHLLGKRADTGEAVRMPVYCTANGRRNARRIITIAPDTDSVPDFWADEIRGVDDNVAIAMTRGWQEQLAHPRLAEDGPWAHAFGSGNVKVTRDLACADDNLALRSFLSDRLGVAAHFACHSRRMGYLVGGLLRARCSPEAIAYVRNTLQAPDADTGDPIDAKTFSDWLKKNEAGFTVAGWRLDHVAIKLDPKAADAARNLAGSDPEPYVRIQTADDHRTLFETDTKGRTYAAQWDSNFILWRGPSYLIGVYAQHNLKHDTSLGDHLLKSNETPPTTLPADVAKKTYWSGDFHWTPVHF